VSTPRASGELSQRGGASALNDTGVDARAGRYCRGVHGNAASGAAGGRGVGCRSSVGRGLRTLYVAEPTFFAHTYRRGTVFAGPASYIESGEVRPILAATRSPQELCAARANFSSKSPVGTVNFAAGSRRGAGRHFAGRSLPAMRADSCARSFRWLFVLPPAMALAQPRTARRPAGRGREDRETSARRRRRTLAQ
jgi:hypothetical protein